jgi:hypothetical protein
MPNFRGGAQIADLKQGACRGPRSSLRIETSIQAWTKLYPFLSFQNGSTPLTATWSISSAEKD